MKKKDILDLSLKEQVKLDAKDLMKLSLDERRKILEESVRLSGDLYKEDGELRKFKAIDGVREY